MKPAPPVTIARTARILRTDVRDVRGPRRLRQDDAGRAAARSALEAARAARWSTTREPGGTPLGERDPRARPARRGRCRPGPRPRSSPPPAPSSSSRVIRPALERGAPSSATATSTPRSPTRAIARGLGVDARARAEPAAIRGLLPDRTFLLARRPAAAARARRRRAATGSSARTRQFRAARRRRVPRAGGDLPAADRGRSTATRPAARDRQGDPWSAFDDVPEQAEAKRLLARGARGRAGARVSLPRAAGRRQAARRASPSRRELLGDARPRRARRASRSLRARAARRPDPHRRRSGSCAATCTCARSRPTAAST